MLVLVAVSGVLAATAGAADETVRLWPGAAPGTEDWKVEERMLKVPVKDAGMLTLVTDVTVPTLTVVRPDPAQSNGTAVIVCPGGGFQFLSWESEGMEVARWLAGRGVTAFVLKYRVRMANDGGTGKEGPTTFEAALKAGEPKINIARADAIQAIRHLRANADQYGIARDRIGLMGFSAGAMTTMSVVLKGDAADWPNFIAPVYGAMEDAPVPKDAPPLFIVHTQADAMVPAAQATRMFDAWTAAGRPAELHLYQAGPHGFGMRKVGSPVDGWTDAFEGWLRAGHLLERQAAPEAAEAADEKDAVGSWRLKYDPGDGQTHEPVLTITKAGPALEAEFIDGDQKGVVKEVQFKDGELRVEVETQYNGETATTTYAGKPDGDTLKGEAAWEYQGLTGSFSFEGKREAEEPQAGTPSVVAVPGKPSLPLGNYDVAPLGYQVEEFFVSGTATSYKLAGKASEDGKWDAVPAGTAPYTTRIVVVRPSDPAKFSGTVVVEWLNVTGNLDVPVEWNMAHREILRRGHAYVGVSTQRVGIEGQPGPQRPGIAALKQADPERYGRLEHPGDAYAFDIFSQAGRLVKDAATSRVLGPLVPTHVLAGGESQGAFFLTTYVTAVDPIAKVYDGFLLHSRFGIAAALGDSALAAIMSMQKAVKLRPDLRVPVLTVLAENDVLGWPPILGYHAARQPDTDRLRVWEVAGTAHADNYVFAVGFIDSGSLPIEKFAEAYAPTDNAMGGKLDHPMNFAPQHHYVVEAALWQLDRWVRTGQAAPSASPLKLTEDKVPKLVTDANGLAEGGLRTPWVDVPTALLSGVGNSGGPAAGMVGIGKPYDAATLDRLYPGGKAEYLEKFEASLDAAIAAGFILPEDKQEIMGLAAFSFTGKAKD
jgi:acetyl esterase/lipase